MRTHLLWRNKDVFNKKQIFITFKSAFDQPIKPSINHKHTLSLHKKPFQPLALFHQSLSTSAFYKIFSAIIRLLFVIYVQSFVPALHLEVVSTFIKLHHGCRRGGGRQAGVELFPLARLGLGSGRWDLCWGLLRRLSSICNTGRIL